MGSKVVQQVINSTIIHIIWVIWMERNQRYFHNKKTALTTMFNRMLAEVKLSYNLSLVHGVYSMQDYKISTLFNIPFKTRRARHLQDIAWSPPGAGTVKFNCDGSSAGVIPCGAIGVVIRDSSLTFLGAITSNIGHASAIEAEFCACMIAIEKAMEMCLTDICVETYSLKVVNAYHKQIGIPWQMRIRWQNCLRFCNSITALGRIFTEKATWLQTL